MPSFDFDIPEPTLRTGFDRTLVLQAGWMVLVGAVFLALPASRFGSPSWQFVEVAPHGDDLLGCLYAVTGLALAYCLWEGRSYQRRLAFTLGLAGMLNWTMGIFLLAGALHGALGGLGFPLALFPGTHMISTAATLSSRGRH